MYNPTRFEQGKQEQEQHKAHKCINCFHMFYGSSIQFCSKECEQEYDDLGPYERFTNDSPERYDIWFEA